MGKLIQQINLYQPRFRREKKAFSLSVLLMIAALALLAMAGLQGYGFLQNQNLKLEHTRLEQQLARLKIDVEKMRTLMPKPTVSKIYEQELLSLQKQRSAGNSLLSSLENRVFSNEKTFSEYFAGLSRQSDDGLWLEALEVNQTKNYFALQGKVIDPELLPQFLQRLESERVFENKVFKVVNMQRVPDSRQISFNLRTENPEEDSE